MSNALQGEVYHRNGLVHHRSGRTIPVSITTIPIAGPGGRVQSAMLVLNRDLETELDTAKNAREYKDYWTTSA